MRTVYIGALLALSGCGSVPQGDVLACAGALVASGQREVAPLLQAAQLSPACNKLAAGALQAAMREALLRVGK